MKNKDKIGWNWFKPGLEFEQFVPLFNQWLAGNDSLCCLVGIRTAESLNRWNTISSEVKQKFKGKKWTTRTGENTYNAYPIYDWKTEDIWKFNGKFSVDYNKLYEGMHRAGISIHKARICQPYGDDQRRGLWMFHVLEPQTWNKIICRVYGANFGALYSQASGNILGNIKISKPTKTWKEFAELLLMTMPKERSEHYKNKIAKFIKWWRNRGVELKDEGGTRDKNSPSWTRICKVLLKNDWWCKGLSFSQTTPDAYDKYCETMKKRREEWKIFQS